MQSWKKGFIKLISIAALLIIAPILIERLIIKNGFPSSIDNEQWFMFLGTYISAILTGGITFLGVRETITYYKNQDESQNVQKELRQIRGVYWLFSTKCRLLQEWKKIFDKYEAAKAYFIPEESIFDRTEFMYYLESAKDINTKVGLEELNLLADFAKDLQTLELRRKYINGLAEEADRRIKNGDQNPEIQNSIAKAYQNGFAPQLELAYLDMGKVQKVLEKMGTFN